MISKIFAKAPIAKLCTRLVLPKSGFVAIASRTFASGKELTPEKGKQKLTKALSRELKYEEENYQKDDTVDNFLKENGWSLKDEESDNNLELRKKVGGTTVIVAFQSRAPQLDDNQGEEDQEQNAVEKKQEGEEGEEGEQNMQDFCDFTVYLQNSAGRVLGYECTSFDSEINVNYVANISDIDKHRKMSRFERNTSLYNGPEFSTLDERLQAALVEYLKGFGITEELAVFVEHVSLDKEQRLYMKWLKDVNDFIEGHQKPFLKADIGKYIRHWKYIQIKN